MSEPRVRYECRVHARNRHAGYGIPVTVYAASRSQAVERAITVGWSGHRGDARVTVDRIVEEPAAPSQINPATGEPYLVLTPTPRPIQEGDNK